MIFGEALYFLQACAQDKFVRQIWPTRLSTSRSSTNRELKAYLYINFNLVFIGYIDALIFDVFL